MKCLAQRFFRKKAAGGEEVSLQITSMADIFTILLVFLLKTYSEGVVTPSYAKDILLPTGKGGDVIADALKVEVSPSMVQVDGKPITALDNFKFQESSQALDAEFEKRHTAQDSRLMVIADQRTPFSTLRRVLNAAATKGFTDYKLVLVKEE